MAKAKNALASGVRWSAWFGHDWDTGSLASQKKTTELATT